MIAVLDMLAAAHIDPRLAGPVAIVIAGGLVWYWIRLGRATVPRGRRRIRRVSLFLMLVSLPNFVAGLSYLDPTVDAPRYVASWSVSMLVVLLVFATAIADALLTLRVQRRVTEAEMTRTGLEILHAVHGASRVSPDGPAGQETPGPDSCGGDDR